MAYLDHYDNELVLLGDRYVIPLIEAVKGAGKKTFGFSYIKKVPRELTRAFYFRPAFNRKTLEGWIK